MSVATDRLAADAVYLSPDDNICVAARNLVGGESLNVGGREITLAESVRLGHNIAVRPIRNGEPGQWVHSHNLLNGDYVRDYAKSQFVPPPPKSIEGRTFLGYKRSSGKAGTRNYIAVISTVNCSATVSKYIAQRFDRGCLRDFP